MKIIYINIIFKLWLQNSILILTGTKIFRFAGQTETTSGTKLTPLTRSVLVERDRIKLSE